MLEYATALAGMTLVTLNPTFRPAELRYALEDSGAVACYASRTFRGRELYDTADDLRPAIASLREVVCLDDGLPSASGGELPVVDPDSAFVMLYTSGTTGAPKGALLSTWQRPTTWPTAPCGSWPARPARRSGWRRCRCSTWRAAWSPRSARPPCAGPKAISLFLAALLKIEKFDGVGQEDLIGSMIETLIALRSPGTSYWCWGYSFPWQTRTIVVPRWAPNAVCTSFVASALLDAYEQRRDPRCLIMAVSAAEYILNDLY